jgi:hypothetical protein
MKRRALNIPMVRMNLGDLDYEEITAFTQLME